MMSSFEGEEYLLEQPPDYVGERRSLIVKLVVVFVFWAIVMPLMLAKEEQHAEDESMEKKKKNGEQKESAQAVDHTNNSKGSLKRRNKSAAKQTSRTTTKSQGETTNGTADGIKKQSSSSPQENNNVETTTVIDGRINVLCTVIMILHVLYVLLASSPDNYYTSRTVFEAPLFTPNECDFLVDMAERVARTNYEVTQNSTDWNIDDDVNRRSNNNTVPTAQQQKANKLLQDPIGWQKSRHEAHPTTDLNLVTDPFTEEDLEYIQDKLNARLAPTLERIYGIPTSAIRANDIFIIRYDGDRQASLGLHTDTGSITFQVLLSSGFEGGGTSFWNRGLNRHFTHVNPPEKGIMSTFPAVLAHEGMQTTKGRRYLMVGFLDVDAVDPWIRHQETGLSWFSSWLSLNWATVKFNDGYQAAARKVYANTSRNRDDHRWHTSKYAADAFEVIKDALYFIGDWMYPHRFVSLVDFTSTEDYLHDLDHAYHHHHQQQQTSSRQGRRRRASWFAGQQIKLDFEGAFMENWYTRDDNADQFERFKASDWK